MSATHEDTKKHSAKTCRYPKYVTVPLSILGTFFGFLSACISLPLLGLNKLTWYQPGQYPKRQSSNQQPNDAPKERNEKIKAGLKMVAYILYWSVLSLLVCLSGLLSLPSHLVCRILPREGFIHKINRKMVIPFRELFAQFPHSFIEHPEAI